MNFNWQIYATNESRWPKLALLSYSSHVQRAKFRPAESVRFFFAILEKLKPLESTQTKRTSMFVVKL